MTYFPKDSRDAEENKFFSGTINGLIVCIPFWMIVLWLIFS